jgi:hypothetical protein
LDSMFKTTSRSNSITYKDSSPAFGHIISYKPNMINIL